jgi:hypothetical protein
MTTESIIDLVRCKSSKEIITKFRGKKLGRGTYRNVYAMKGSPDYVLKIELYQGLRTFANVTEWRNWSDNRLWIWLAQYLAPCLWISEDGKILIQRRVTFKEKKHYPKEIPALFTDTKIQNFGWIGNQFVCCDYSFFVICIGKGNRPMKKVRWKSYQK